MRKPLLIEAIRNIIDDYHYALDVRQLKYIDENIAQAKAIKAIEEILNKPWNQDFPPHIRSERKV